MRLFVLSSLFSLVATKRWLPLIRFLHKWYFVSANSRHRQVYKLTLLRKTEKCIADASSSLFMFLRTMFVRRRWFRREAGRYRRNNIPIATADFALRTSVTIYVYNYRGATDANRASGCIRYIEYLIPDNRVFLSSYILIFIFSHRECRSFLLGKGKGGRKRRWYIIIAASPATRSRNQPIFHPRKELVFVFVTPSHFS